MKEPTEDLEQRLLAYTTKIVHMAESLPSTRAGNHVAGQLLRAGTASLPGHARAQAAESRDDLVLKLRACHRELQESRRWLRFIRHVPLIHSAAEVEHLLAETESLIRIFAASIWGARSSSCLRWRQRHPRLFRAGILAKPGAAALPR